MVSMLYKATPDELKLVLVDPKRLELGLYEDIPHLLAPVVTDPKVASNVLRNATREMERRLKLLAQRGVRNIDQYNRTFAKGQSLSLFENAEEEEHKPLPYIVIVIDELADLMMVDTNGVEESITRLAQMARAVGIHLILATQRPSVDVITGLDQGEFPRAHFVPRGQQSGLAHDSRRQRRRNRCWARGDMLYLPAGSSRLHRIHGPLVTEDEIAARVRLLARAGQGRLQRATARSRRRKKQCRGRSEPAKAAKRTWTTNCIRMPCAWSARWAALRLPRCSGACASATAARRA